MCGRDILSLQKDTNNKVEGLMGNREPPLEHPSIIVASEI